MSRNLETDRGPFVLGIDVGTSSVRALLYDSCGDPVPGIAHQVVYKPDLTLDGAVTVKANDLFDLVVEVLDRVSAKMTVSRFVVQGIGTSCFWHSLLALDGELNPLTPVLLWADTRSEQILPDLTSHVDGTRLHRTTGCGLHSSYWPAKLTWLNATQPEMLTRARHLVSFAEYFYGRCLDEFAVSVSMASGTGLLNLQNCEWDEYACSVIPAECRANLSPISDAPLSTLNAKHRTRWSPLAEAVWFPAYGDGACSNVGATGLQDRTSDFVLTVGTSAAIRVVTSQPCGQASGLLALPAPLWNYRLDSSSGVVGGALSEGGNLIAWLESTLRLPPLPEAEATIAGRAPDAAGLTVLPFIAGERSPDWTIGARAIFSGITQATTPTDFLQAAMESVGYELRLIYDLLVEMVGVPREVFAAGAALGKSPVWRQVIANILARSIRPADQLESSSRGAAILALRALGALSSRNSSEVEQPLVEPLRSAAYDLARLRQQTFRERMVTFDRGMEGAETKAPTV